MGSVRMGDAVFDLSNRLPSVTFGFPNVSHLREPHQPNRFSKADVARQDELAAQFPGPVILAGHLLPWWGVVIRAGRWPRGERRGAKAA